MVPERPSRDRRSREVRERANYVLLSQKASNINYKRIYSRDRAYFRRATELSHSSILKFIAVLVHSTTQLHLSCYIVVLCIFCA